MYHAVVLMSTYNGEKYLPEQLDSILNQEGVRIDLFIRDDGSSDNTTRIIKKYQETYKNIKLDSGENIGYQKSFLNLVFHAGKYDYYAFADQDDVWEKNKIAAAIYKMQKTEVPCMYYSMMTQVDEELHIMAKQQKPKPPLSKRMVLFQNFVQGSTIVFNYKLFQIITKYKPDFNVAHDIWIPCLAVYFGKVIFDTKSYILYRRHAFSVTVNMNKGSYLNNLYQRYKRKEQIDNLAIYIIEGYGDDLNEKDYKRLLYVAQYNHSPGNKYKCILDISLKKYSLKGTLLLKAAFLLNKVEQSKDMGVENV